MTHKLALTLLTITLFAGVTLTASAQSQLNKIRIDACLGEQPKVEDKSKANEEAAMSDEERKNLEKIKYEREHKEFEALVELERKRGLVLDVRPFAINQATGKLSFNGQTGRVTVVNMNPFVYRYTISVAQQELTNSALSDFLAILLPPSLRAGGAQPGQTDTEALKTRLERIAARLNQIQCTNNSDAGCEALKAMKTIVDELQGVFVSPPAIKVPTEFGTYRDDLLKVRNDEADAYGTCIATTQMHAHLDNFFDGTNPLQELENADKQITAAEQAVQDLTQLVADYKADTALKDYNGRCQGFKCVNQFDTYANEAAAAIAPWREEVDSLLATGKQMKTALDATNEMAEQDGLFARTSEIIKRFEFSEATVSVTRTERGKAAENMASNVTKNHKAEATTNGGGAGNGGPNDEDSEEKDDSSKDKKDSGDKEKGSNGNGNGGNAQAPQSNQSIQIGRPRFLLSGGLVFTPMQRRTFDKVTGFTRDANGNPTGDGTDSVIGLKEDSPRRLLPMAVLNTRIHSFSPTSVFFSLGVTAKHDSNVDIEYLIGPSVSLLNERAFFTFGGYLGRVQNLVPDVKIGDKIPDSAGDAQLFTSRYSWKPGFSFTYVMSENSKQSASLDAGGTSASGKQADLKNEIRIGGIPFNLAMGLVYSSLEDQTYDEILGFARDRQGNLTNGETLTRIAGLTSDSSYRVIPMVMLHSRLLDFGSRSFYFSTGVSGRKVDDAMKVEYLLGGSVNVYKRKLFFTFGAFAGKRQVLGGDFFTGAALGKDQSVTTHDRYIWKPAFGFSYDMSRVFRRESQYATKRSRHKEAQKHKGPIQDHLCFLCFFVAYIIPRHGTTITRSPIRVSHVTQVSRVLVDGDRHARARHRREHDDLQRRQRCHGGATSLPRTRSPRAHLGE